jgi:L-iditol 2-dehydrogenase
VKTILICGAGPAGLLFTGYLRNVLDYDERILVSEPNAKKRELASRLGAEVIDPLSVDPVEAVLDITKGRQVEYVIEASGSGSVIALLPGLIRKQATVLLYGQGHAGHDMSLLNNVLFREPALIASVGASGGFTSEGRPEIYARALSLLEEGKVRVAQLITHRYDSLECAPGAFAGDHHAPDYVKGVVLI